jgi:ribosome-associated protein
MSEPGPPRPPILLPPADAALLAQCDVETFHAQGPGGQHVNKADSAVRLRHRPTGLAVTSQHTRSQFQNKLDCLRKLRELVARLNYRPPRRRPTRKSRAVRRRELGRKAQQAAKKHGRRRPAADD